ncbi:ROK family transcriptional regulator [Sporosarcina pasteurii]|uniref:Making large colonies protein n=1 Tax=Sporosarcina pasteurii TaxID=1474 RepID=A0A380BDD3_SPOPA|nr:ROK family transcriptional regulator [Sporosarcina pasteurii]MDS9472497.1 ROK family transcriptional regulator [Sporosarcina pasteurii]QBQ06052.1 ROK family transcriptional regulator [Sporosarcina pasteurii]SUI99619.1 Making large colonies protein [Sporosarcina pasteurii]
MREGTFQWMKSVNRSIILNKIRTDAPISRAQIAKETKLTPPTVSSNVKSLIEEGVVVESELGESQGGRKPTMLLINDEAFYVIGTDAGPTKIECVIADLAGNIHTRNSIALTVPITNDEFLIKLTKCIRELIAAATIDTDKLIGIGVAMHGVVDVETGTSLIAPNLGLTNIPIKAVMEEEFRLPVKVENDARVMALGEAWFGNHEVMDNMLAVNVGRGVGAGIVVGGKLFHGANNIAGEIGHMTIDIHGEVCECGNRGCLQTFATGAAIAKRANLRMQHNNAITAEKVYELALSGDHDCREILEETGSIIGVGLMNLIHIINPAKIVIGGGVMKSGKFILPAIQKAIEKHALTPEAKQTEVEITKLGDDATIIGAVALVLVTIFEPTA